MCVVGAELACLQAALSTSTLNFPISLSTLVETQDELAQAWSLLVADETTASLVTHMMNPVYGLYMCAASISSPHNPWHLQFLELMYHEGVMGQASIKGS